jgi:hypothetical protein
MSNATPALGEHPMSMSRPLLIACVLWVCFIAIAHSDAGSGMGLFLFLYGSTLAWGLIWLIRILIHAWRCRREIAPENRGVAHWLLEPLMLVLAVVLAESGVPRHLRFMASRPALTRYVQSDRPPSHDYLAGNGGVPDATRILDYPIGGSTAEVTALTKRILQELCGVSPTEALDIKYEDK